jgi:uncharacterized protein (TIGR02147 family)
MLSIYQYQKAEDYLQDVWNEKRKKNSLFTIRAWAAQMSLTHHNPLHEMIKGKRKVPKATIPKLISSLGLNAHEGLYFESMIDLSRARSVEEKTIYLERMKTLSPKQTVMFTELESFRMLQNPLHFFVAELAHQKDFKSDANWIKERLTHNYSLIEINEVLERLINLDILREDIDGKLHRVDQFIQSKSDISDKALKEYHKNLMNLAKDAVDTQDVMSREFQGMALNVDTSRLPEAKKSIRNFVAQFTKEFDQPKAKNEELYQLNLQFFGITKTIKKGTTK